MDSPNRNTGSWRRWLGLAIVLAAVLVDLVDVSVVVIAAPRIAGDLGASPAELQWIVAVYALAFGVLLTLGGRLGDIIGRRRTFLIGTVLFTLASAGCAISPDTTTLIAARAAAGVGAALMAPQVFSIIQTTLTESERPRAFGAYGAVVALGGGLAPPLGGLLLELDPGGLSWRLMFLINIPIGILAVAGAAVFVQESRAEVRPGLDGAGTVMLGAGLLLVLYPLVTLGYGDVSLLAGVGGVLGIVVLVLFGRLQRRREQQDRPVLVLMSVMRRPEQTVALFAMMAAAAGLSAYTIVLTLQLQDGHGLEPLVTGLVLMAWPIGVGLSANTAPMAFVARWLAPRQLLVGGLLLTAGMALLIASIGQAVLVGGAMGGAADIALRVSPGLFLGGMGMGLYASAATAGMMSWAPAHAVGSVSGTVNAGMQVAMAIGTVVATSLFTLARPDVTTGPLAPPAADTAGMVALTFPLVAFAVATAGAVALRRILRGTRVPVAAESV